MTVQLWQENWNLKQYYINKDKKDEWYKIYSEPQHIEPKIRRRAFIFSVTVVCVVLWFHLHLTMENMSSSKLLYCTKIKKIKWKVLYKTMFPQLEEFCRPHSNYKHCFCSVVVGAGVSFQWSLGERWDTMLTSCHFIKRLWRD